MVTIEADGAGFCEQRARWSPCTAFVAPPPTVGSWPGVDWDRRCVFAWFGHIPNWNYGEDGHTNEKNILLGIFATLTIVFAAATALEYQQVASLNSQIPAESTTASCTATGGIGCPHFFNDTYTVSVNYVGPWGLTYQGYFGDSQASGQLVESGSFYGNSSANETVVVAGTSSVGTLLCAVAQKLDGSNSTLLLTIRGSSANQTYVAYGSTKVCVAHVIA